MTRLTHMTTLLAAASLLAAPACTKRSNGAGGGDATTDGTTDGGGSDDGTASGTSGSSDAGDTEDTQGGDDTTDGGPQPVVMCDYWAQDCPEGQKCTQAATSSSGWDAHICVDAGTDPPLTPCTIVEGADPYGATDTCDATGFCYNLDPDTGIGTCIEMCVGTPESDDCPITGFECKQLARGFGNLCIPQCTPVPETCPECFDCPLGQNCVAAFGGDTLVGFTCYPPAAEGTTGESCECANCCAEAHMCTDAATYGQGCAFNLCCTEYCDVTDGGFTCAGSGQQCVALFEATDQYYASVGACMVP